MNEDAVYTALESVKGVPRDTPREASLLSNLGFESIDVVDLFFEIEQATGIVIELNQIVGQMGASSARRFEDLSIQDLIDYLDRAK